MSDKLSTSTMGWAIKLRDIMGTASMPDDVTAKIKTVIVDAVRQAQSAAMERMYEQVSLALLVEPGCKMQQAADALDACTSIDDISWWIAKNKNEWWWG